MAVIGLVQLEVGLADHGGAVPGVPDVPHVTLSVAIRLGSTPPCAVFVDVDTCHQLGPCRHAQQCIRVAASEDDALGGQTVEVWCLDCRVTDTPSASPRCWLEKISRMLVCLAWDVFAVRASTGCRGSTLDESPDDVNGRRRRLWTEYSEHSIYFTFGRQPRTPTNRRPVGPPTSQNLTALTPFCRRLADPSPLVGDRFAAREDCVTTLYENHDALPFEFKLRQLPRWTP